MADLRRAFAPLGPHARFLLFAIVVEAALLLGEMLLVHAVGQRAIAAAMITAPKSGTALLGAAAVLVRITAHAIFPAICAFVAARKAAVRVFS
jgi:hypothetical protein